MFDSGTMGSPAEEVAQKSEVNVIRKLSVSLVHVCTS